MSYFGVAWPILLATRNVLTVAHQEHRLGPRRGPFGARLQEMRDVAVKVIFGTHKTSMFKYMINSFCKKYRGCIGFPRMRLCRQAAAVRSWQTLQNLESVRLGRNTLEQLTLSAFPYRDLWAHLKSRSTFEFSNLSPTKFVGCKVKCFYSAWCPEGISGSLQPLLLLLLPCLISVLDCLTPDVGVSHAMAPMGPLFGSPQASWHARVLGAGLWQRQHPNTLRGSGGGPPAWIEIRDS